MQDLHRVALNRAVLASTDDGSDYIRCSVSGCDDSEHMVCGLRVQKR